MRRIGVIGSVNRDTIRHPEGRCFQDLGGILYTIWGLSHLGGKQVEIWPFIHIGTDLSSELDALLRGRGNIVVDGIREVAAESFHSHIEYSPDGSKSERLRGEIPPLQWNELRPYIGRLDGLVVNFITGFEIELETLHRIRQTFSFPLVMDVHSLTLGRRENDERYWRKPDDWEDWIAPVDVVQMNEAEAMLLGDLPEADERALIDFGRRLLAIGPNGCGLTRGKSGCIGVYRENGQTEAVTQPACNPEAARETTGCGDVFLAGLGMGVISGSSFPQALRHAGQIASYKSRHRGIRQMLQLRDRDS